MSTNASGLREFARKHTIAVTGVLSVVALALVFAVALELVPGGSLPRPPDAILAAIPHVNAALSLVAICTITVGVRFARREEYHRHRVAMVTSTGLFAAFLFLYLYRVAILGPTEFGGPATIAQFIYYPILAVHITLAVVCVPLVIYALVLGTTRSIHEIPSTNHARIGRVAAPLWIVTFALGIVVYLLLYHLY